MAIKPGFWTVRLNDVASGLASLAYKFPKPPVIFTVVDNFAKGPVDIPASDYIFRITAL